MKSVRLQDVADFINGYAFKPSDWDGQGKKIIRIQNLTDSSKPYNSTSLNVDDKYVVRQGDLLVSWSATLGVFEWNDEDALLNQHIFKVVINDNVVDKGYLKRALNNAILDMEKHLHGATMRHINRQEFLETPIPLPPLEEQKHIAAILDKADAIRRKRARALQLTDQFLQSVFLDMFGDPKTKISPFPFKTIRNYVKAQSGKSSKKVFSKIPTEIPIYGGNGINGYATESLFDEPVIVAGRVGQQCGIIHLTSGPSWVTDNAIVIQVKEKRVIEPLYLSFAFQISPIRNTVVHLDLPFINQSMLLDYPIPLPPIELQHKFANIYREFYRKYYAHQQKTMTKMTDSFDCLCQNAFKGEL